MSAFGPGANQPRMRKSALNAVVRQEPGFGTGLFVTSLRPWLDARLRAPPLDADQSNRKPEIAVSITFSE